MSEGVVMANAGAGLDRELVEAMFYEGEAAVVRETIGADPQVRAAAETFLAKIGSQIDPSEMLRDLAKAESHMPARNIESFESVLRFSGLGEVAIHGYIERFREQLERPAAFYERPVIAKMIEIACENAEAAVSVTTHRQAVRDVFPSREGYLAARIAAETSYIDGKTALMSEAVVDAITQTKLGTPFKTLAEGPKAIDGAGEVLEFLAGVARNRRQLAQGMKKARACYALLDLDKRFGVSIGMKVCFILIDGHKKKISE